MQGPRTYPISSPTNHFVNPDIPIVLLTPDFVIAQHNRAFSNVLSLLFTARAQTLFNLVVPAEREKIQRLQTELRETAYLSLMRGG